MSEKLPPMTLKRIAELRLQWRDTSNVLKWLEQEEKRTCKMLKQREQRKKKG